MSYYESQSGHSYRRKRQIGSSSVFFSLSLSLSCSFCFLSFSILFLPLPSHPFFLTLMSSDTGTRMYGSSCRVVSPLSCTCCKLKNTIDLIGTIFVTEKVNFFLSLLPSVVTMSEGWFVAPFLLSLHNANGKSNILHDLLNFIL